MSTASRRFTDSLSFAVKLPVLSTVSVALPFAAMPVAGILHDSHIHLGSFAFVFLVAPIAGFVIAMGSFMRGEEPRWVALLGFVLNLFWACIASLFGLMPSTK